MTSSAAQPETGDDRTVMWSAHPARQRPMQAVAAAAVVLALAGGAALLGGSLWWGLGALIVLSASLNRFLAPSTFTIDERGIEARYPLKKQRLAWNRVRRFVHDQRGGYLSTRVNRSWVDAYRGMHVLFDDDRDLRIEQIRARMSESERRSTADSRNQSPSAGVETNVAMAGGSTG